MNKSNSNVAHWSSTHHTSASTAVYTNNLSNYIKPSTDSEHIGQKWLKKEPEHKREEENSRSYLDQGAFLTFMAVAAFKAFEHGGYGEGQKQHPYDDGDVGRFLEGFQEVLFPGVDDVKVAVDGDDGEEGDAGPSVQEQHEEHGFAHSVVPAPPLSLDEVVRLYGQTEQQEHVGQHQVEQEDVGFPELHFEYEQVEDRRIERQSQDENHNHHSCVEFVQRLVCGLAVLDQLVNGVIVCVRHWNSLLSGPLLARTRVKKNPFEKERRVLCERQKEVSPYELLSGSPVQRVELLSECVCVLLWARTRSGSNSLQQWLFWLWCWCCSS